MVYIPGVADLRVLNDDVRGQEASWWTKKKSVFLSVEVVSNTNVALNNLQ